MLERGLVEPVQHENLAAREQRPIQLEGGIFGGGADEDDRPILDIGQEAILLGAIEAVNLVDEQERAASRLAALPGSVEDFAKIGHAAEHGSAMHHVCS